MTFYENRLNWIRFFKTEPHTYILIYISIFIRIIYYIKLLLFFFLILLILFFVQISFNTTYEFHLINFVSISYVSNIINHFYFVLLIFYKSYVIFCIKPTILSYFYKIIINKKVTICNMDIQKSIQIKPH